MIKKTLYFGNPAYLSTKNEQIVIKKPTSTEDRNEENEVFELEKTVPIEDVGICILDNFQITITQGLIEKMLQNNIALIHCNSKSMPNGIMLPMVGNTLQSERYGIQLEASLPLKKQLWQQTIMAKINNQAAVLKKNTQNEIGNMIKWSKTVKSDDSDNLEARAAVYYWSHLFHNIPKFRRDRDGIFPNNLLNYGYAILRAIIARALVSTGLLPAVGIHHHSKYNPYCLADDIMEPFRPYIDEYILTIMEQFPQETELTKEVKAALLKIPVLDVNINNNRSPLMTAASTTTSSLFKCYTGELRKIIYPIIPI